MRYSECSSSCPRTCASIRTPITECEEHCLDGCACLNGTILRHDGVCVREEDCPCIHNDKLYHSGHVIRQECMTWYGI